MLAFNEFGRLFSLHIFSYQYALQLEYSNYIVVLINGGRVCNYFVHICYVVPIDLIRQAVSIYF